MKLLKYSWFIALLVVVLASCALPATTFTVRIPPASLALATPWEGGPPQATFEAEVGATAIAIATVEAPQEETTPVAEECLIKANVGRNRSAIYHMPTGAYYDLIKIDPNQGDRYYCTEEEAVADGFRKSLR